MNRKLAATSLLLAAAFAGNAFAESPLQGNDPFTSSVTGAQVRAELADFQRSGVDPSAQHYQPLMSFRSETTRAAVVGDYLASRDLVHAFTGEDSGSSHLARTHGPSVPADTLAGQPQNAH